MAQAVVVLMTPDDEARLQDALAGADEADIVAGQARPNVVLELGMAIALYPERTILVTMGRLRSISDISGLYEIRLDGTVQKRQYLYDRLRDCDCDVQLQGRWTTAGDLDAVIQSLKSRAAKGAPQREQSSQTVRSQAAGAPEIQQSTSEELPQPNPQLKGIVEPQFASGYLQGVTILAEDAAGRRVPAVYHYIFEMNGHVSPASESCCTPLSIGMGGVPRGTTWSVRGWVKWEDQIAPLSGSGIA
jgi:hypothetical protein